MATLIHNAKVYLEREKFAQAVLVENGIITRVGSDGELTAAAPAGTETIDAQGRLLLPGFNDSHLHLHDFGRNIHRIQAYGVTSIDELVECGRELIERLRIPEGSVVIGTGWNQDLFTDEKRHPNRHDIDRISTRHAVIIDRVCGHSVCCNSYAMEMAGIDRGTPQVEGGQMDLDTDGEPLGIFRENAIYNIKKIIPPYTHAQIKEQLEYAMRHALENGLTSVASRDVIDENYQGIIDAFAEIFDEGKIRLRVTMQCSLEEETVLDEFVRRGWVTNKMLHAPYLKMGPLKLFADGSLGSQTAYMRRPYNDDPSTVGLRVMPPQEMNALVQKADKNGLQVIIHSIGDAAVDEVVSAFETVSAEHHNPLRHAVVHCQITDLPLLERIAKNDILAIVQPVFLTHDLYIVESRVGKELAATSYAFKTMEKLGIRTAYGTDCPVERMSALECIDCAVNRQDVDSGYPEGGFYPGECVDVYTAVDNYTAGSAYATFEENCNGRIKAGYMADLVLLDKDIFTVPSRDIKTARVLMTMVDGHVVYRREDA